MELPDSLARFKIIRVQYRGAALTGLVADAAQQGATDGMSAVQAGAQAAGRLSLMSEL